MRPLDLVPVGLVLGLAAAVGAMAVRSAGQVAPPLASVDSGASAPGDETEPPAPSDAPGTNEGHVRSETRLSRLAPPDFDRDDVLRRLGYGAAGTYIVPMLETDSGLARWPERPGEPVRVWIEPTSSLPDWRPEYVDSARRAFDHWRTSGIPVRINFLVDSTDAEVRVRWVDRLEEMRIGSTRRIRDQHWWLVAGDISLALHSSKGEPLGPSIVAATAIHEAGHLLGLNHSPDSADLMATHHTRVHRPSPADLATIRLLYTVPPGRLR